MDKSSTSGNSEQIKDEYRSMPEKERQVLLIIDDAKVSKELDKAIQDRFGYEVETAVGEEKALRMIEESPWQYDVIVIYEDLKEKFSSLEFLREIKKNYPEIEVIFVIASKEKEAYSALHEFAFGCFFLPIHYEGIAYAVKFARDHAQSQRERKMLEKLQELSIAINSAYELRDIQNLACQAAVETLNVDHSGLVEFGKDLAIGTVIAEYPETKNFIGTEIQIKGIPAEERLVYNKEIVNITDLSTRNDLGKVQTTLMGLNIRSLLIVPVILDNKVIASFSLDMIRKKRASYSDEVEVFKKLANQVAAAMGKARYLKELHVLNKIALENRAIVPVDPKISDSEIKEKINSMLEGVRLQAGTLLDVKNFYIALYNEEKDEYYVPYHADEKDDINLIPQEKRRKGMTAYVRKIKKATSLNSIKIQELIDKGEIELVGALPSIWLGVPLIAREKVLGVMAVQNYKNEHAYDEHDLTVLQTIASQVAIVIDNTQLFKDAQRRIRDLEIVDSIARTISTHLNTEDLFKTMVEQIAENLNCSHCTIFLPEQRNGELRLVPQETHGSNSEQIMTRTFSTGEGLAGWVFQHGESIVTPDARYDGRYAQSRQRGNLPHSMLVAPVKVGDRTIGVISADQDEYNWFSETDRQLVDTLAKHAGIAIERALGLNLLHEIGLQLISSENEKKILQRVVTGAIELTNTTAGILYLIGEDGKSVIKQFSYPPDFKHPPPRMENEKGFTRQIIDTGEMIIVPDVRIDVRINRELLKKDLGAMIGVPLKIGKKVLGVLYLNAKKTRTFSETELSLLEILASRAAIAIYNSRLYQESQRQLKEIKALYETSQEIVGASLSIKSVLNKILKMAVELSKADSAQIIFRDESTNQHKIVFTHRLDELKGFIFKQGEGITSKVLETGKSIYTGDYHNHPDKAKIFEKPEYRNLYNSLAIVPLKWKGEVFGAIAVTSVSFNHFKENDIRLLERFSDPAAIAISIAREISFRQTLLNNSPIAITAVDKKGIVKEFNKASEQILGYTMVEVLGRSVVELWGSLDAAKRIKRLMRTNENGTVSHIEAFVKNKIGEKVPILFSGSLLYSEDYGEIKEEIGSIGHFEDQRIVSLKGRTRRVFDVIEQINRSNELKEILTTVLVSSIELFKADVGCILMKEDDHLKMMDTYGLPKNIDREIKIKIGEGLIGQTAQEGKNRPISEFTTDDPYIPFSRDGKSALIIPFKIENRLIGVLYLESNLEDHFWAEDVLHQILSAAVNRAQLQEERERTREGMFTSAKAVAAGQIATGFVHEVKNSLNTIALTVKNIGKRIQKEPDIKSKQEYIDKIKAIETEIWRSYELSKRLQRFGQRMTPQKLETYLNEVVTNTLELLESTIKKQKIKLDLKLDSALDKHDIAIGKPLKGDPIYIDKVQIEQVIINLILNAIEASNPGSRLLVDTKFNESTAEIRITDYGKGITSEDLSEIFKPFFTTKQDGVGLGLYICKLIVEESHQGKIYVTTKPEKGTTFSVQLPIKTKS